MFRGGRSGSSQAYSPRSSCVRLLGRTLRWTFGSRLSGPDFRVELRFDFGVDRAAMSQPMDDGEDARSDGGHPESAPHARVPCPIVVE